MTKSKLSLGRGICGLRPRGSIKRGMTSEKRNTAIFTAFDDVETPELATPERNLLRAVLLNAISDMHRDGEFSRKARDYFLSKDDDYLFSFQSVCDFLSINPHHILIIVGLEKSDRFPIKSLEEALQPEVEPTPRTANEAALEEPFKIPQ